MSALPSPADCLETLLRGPGYLRGTLPVEGRSIEDIAADFLAFGRSLGTLLPQNAKGHLLGHVCDLGLDGNDPGVRIYQTNDRQGFHTDSADLVALLCLQPAREGGLSTIVPIRAVHDRLQETDPDALATLLEPFHTDHRGEEPPGQPPFFTAPILHRHEGEVSVLYQRRYIESAQRFDGVAPLSARQVRALDVFDAILEDPDYQVRMELQPGDVQVIHNHAVLHDRSAFVDDPDRPRHLLRMWICPSVGRPLPECFAERLRSVEVGDRGGVVPRVPVSTPLQPE